MSVRAADEFGLGHDAGAIAVNCLKKKPWNGGRVRRGTLCDNLSFYGAAIKIPPAGAGAVYAYFGSGCFVERGVGGLKDPLRDVRDQLALVDLNAFASDGEDRVLRGRWVGRILGGCRSREECYGHDQEKVNSVHDRAVYANDVSPSLEEQNGVCRITPDGKILE